MVGRSLATFSGKPAEYCTHLPDIAAKFLDATSSYAIQGLNPGGIYKGIWARDASFIIQDWFLSGKDLRILMDEVVNIWSHQIATKGGIPATKQGKKVVYGRGSPKLGYKMTDSAVLVPNHSFNGALPTTIFDNFAEVYGEKPDIDSTALMISATSSILTATIEKAMVSSTKAQNIVAAQDDNGDVSYPNLLRVIDSLVPRLLEGIEYLKCQDIDDDGLLEQGYNEDWMDTALRAGRIVYSQACWLLALRGLCSLLSLLGYSMLAEKMLGLAKQTIHAVEEKMWSEKDGCYVDLLHPSENYRTILTQDASLYLVALSEYLADHIDDSQSMWGRSVFEGISQEQIHCRTQRTLDTFRSKIWAKSEFEWPLVTSHALAKSGPRVLDKHEYHNHAFWPWITGIEMLARSRFGRLSECLLLLSTVASEDGPKEYSLYEWVDPNTLVGKGAVPFRTGISSIRLAIADIAMQQSGRK
ncbi:MAG: hypothetical protein AB1351_08570 [Thermoproteota archaeon]